MSVIDIFFLFTKISALTFGGGYAMIPLFQSELVTINKLIESSEFANMVALAQMTPGPVGLNAATYIGAQQLGFTGAVVGTIAITVPSIILGPIVIYFLDKLKDNKSINGIMLGLRAATFGLIFSAVIFFAETSIFNKSIKSLFQTTDGFKISWGALLIFFIVFILNFKTKIHILWLVGIGGILGLLIFFLGL